MLSDAGKNASSPLWEGRRRRGVKIVKAERKAEGENEVFGLGFAEALPILGEAKDTERQAQYREENKVLFPGFFSITTAILQNVRKILQGPIHQCFEVRHQIFPARGKAVFYPRGNLRENFPMQKSVGLQIAKGNGKHPLGNIPQTAVDFSETERSVGFERNEHQERPFVSQTPQKIPDGANSGMMKIFHTPPPFSRLFSDKSSLFVSYLSPSTFLTRGRELPYLCLPKVSNLSIKTKKKTWQKK